MLAIADGHHVLAVASFSIGAAFAQERGFRFTETTGRAVIMDADLQQEAADMRWRRPCILAALKAVPASTAGCDVGYVAEDHFVCPSRKPSGYTITNEVIGEQHYEVTIRRRSGVCRRRPARHDHHQCSGVQAAICRLQTPQPLQVQWPFRPWLA